MPEIPQPLRRPAGIAICLIVATLAAVANVASLSILPPKIEARDLQVAGAQTEIVFDRPRSLVSDQLASEGDYRTLHDRAVLLGGLMTAEPAMRYIARRAKLDPDRIAAVTRVTADVQAAITEPDSERRASDIHDETKPYRLEVQPSTRTPTLTIFTQAPTVAEATRLADAAAAGLEDYRRSLARRAGASEAAGLRFEQLGHARGAVLNAGMGPMIAMLTFACVFVLVALLLTAGSRLRLGWASRESGARAYAAPPAAAAHAPRPDALLAPERLLAAERVNAPERPADAPVGVLAPGMLAPAVAVGGGAMVTAPPARLRVARPEQTGQARQLLDAAGDWPRTTRVLPWMVAVFIAMIWVVPFNVITLDVPFPIDLTFDRLVLPVLCGIWALALAAGTRYAPRVRMTWIHVAIGAMFALACASLVINALDLNHSLEFDLGVKKLALLASYLLIFVVVASVVRRTEVQAFLTLTLGLAIICALGTVWEYRFKYNFFYGLSDQILPGIFQVGLAESAALDDIGRRVVRGPAEIPLETVAMLTMALPIAIVGLIRSGHWRRRLLYGVCIALLLAATVSTFRKSAFVAPISVVLTLAYYRRRELVRLAPLGVVVLVMIHVLSPGAFGSITSQLSGDRLNVPTVNDRSSDYDAVRPDVWSHMTFGRGYGTYEHTSYRILDMELLRQLIEVGVLGLAAYLLTIVAVIATARRPIRARSPGESPIALVAAASAVGFLVLSLLFDIMSFPHAPYIFLCTAGLLAAALAPAGDRKPSWSS